MDRIKDLLPRFIIRGKDKGGSGAFGASRSNKKGIHEGIDLLVDEGEPIYSPFDMTMIRKATPYSSDSRYSGGLYSNGIYQIKIFYMNPIEKHTFKKGEVIGYAQNIKKKYPSVTNHIHLEMRDESTNTLLDPTKYV